MLFYVLADLVSILVRHNDVGDYNIRLALLDGGQCTGGVSIRDYVNVLASKRDLDHLAHGRAIAYENYCRSAGHLNLLIEQARAFVEFT